MGPFVHVTSFDLILEEGARFFLKMYVDLEGQRPQVTFQSHTVTSGRAGSRLFAPQAICDYEMRTHLIRDSGITAGRTFPAKSEARG